MQTLLILEAVIFLFGFLMSILSLLSGERIKGLSYFETLDKEILIQKEYSFSNLFKESLDYFKKYKYPFNYIFATIKTIFLFNFYGIIIFASFRWIAWIFIKKEEFIINIKMKGH